MSSRNAVRIAGWTAAGLVAAGAVGIGVANAADPSPSGSTTPAPSAPAPGDHPDGHPGWRHGFGGPRGGMFGHRAGALAGRAMHGELVVKDKDGKPVTVQVQRGSVTAVSASSITLRSDDGFTASYTITSDTRVRINEKGSTAAEVKTGDEAMVSARKDGDATNAQFVVVRQK